MIHLDVLRQTYPLLGLAAYALDPGGDVTLEVHTPTGEYFTFRAPTLAACIEKAFPYRPPASAAPLIVVEQDVDWTKPGEDIFG